MDYINITVLTVQIHAIRLRWAITSKINYERNITVQ